MKITDLNLNNDDNGYIDSILEVLSKGMSKTDLAIRVKTVVGNYNKVSINGLIRDIITDLQCHLDLYSSDTNDYRFKNNAFTFIEGIDRYIGILKLIKQNKDFELPDNIYKIYQRWIIFNNDRIEVEPLLFDNWNYYLFKDIKEDNYYFSIMLNVSAAYWDKVFKVSEVDKLNLKIAIELDKKDEINLIADRIRNEYYAENLKK
jgi:hypothetical protein